MKSPLNEAVSLGRKSTGLLCPCSPWNLGHALTLLGLSFLSVSNTSSITATSTFQWFSTKFPEFLSHSLQSKECMWGGSSGLSMLWLHSP